MDWSCIPVIPLIKICGYLHNVPRVLMLRLVCKNYYNNIYLNKKLKETLRLLTSDITNESLLYVLMYIDSSYGELMWIFRLFGITKKEINYIHLTLKRNNIQFLVDTYGIEVFKQIKSIRFPYEILDEDIIYVKSVVTKIYETDLFKYNSNNFILYLYKLYKLGYRKEALELAKSSNKCTYYDECIKNIDILNFFLQNSKLSFDQQDISTIIKTQEDEFIDRTENYLKENDPSLYNHVKWMFIFHKYNFNSDEIYSTIFSSADDDISVIYENLIENFSLNAIKYIVLHINNVKKLMTIYGVLSKKLRKDEMIWIFEDIAVLIDQSYLKLYLHIVLKYINTWDKYVMMSCILFGKICIVDSYTFQTTFDMTNMTLIKKIIKNPVLKKQEYYCFDENPILEKLIENNLIDKTNIIFPRFSDKYALFKSYYETNGLMELTREEIQYLLINDEFNLDYIEKFIKNGRELIEENINLVFFKKNIFKCLYYLNCKLETLNVIKYMENIGNCKRMFEFIKYIYLFYGKEAVDNLFFSHGMERFTGNSFD